MQSCAVFFYSLHVSFSSRRSCDKSLLHTTYNVFISGSNKIIFISLSVLSVTLDTYSASVLFASASHQWSVRKRAGCTLKRIPFVGIHGPRRIPTCPHGRGGHVLRSRFPLFLALASCTGTYVETRDSIDVGKSRSIEVPAFC